MPTRAERLMRDLSAAIEAVGWTPPAGYVWPATASTQPWQPPVRRDDGPCVDCGGTGWATRLRRGSSYHDTQEVVGRCQCAAGRRLQESKEDR